MNETTLLVSQVAGPLYLALGLGFFVSRSTYEQLYKQMRKEPSNLMTMAILAMVLGIVIVLNHNLWGSTLEVIVSVMAWGALVKGVLLAVFPGQMTNFAENLPLPKMLPWAGVVCLVIGGYLSWAVYLA
jgi:hypothetical protein